MTSPAADQTSTRRGPGLWTWIARFAKVAIAVNIGLAVWLIGFRHNEAPPPVVPETEFAFSLDLRINATAEHPLIYAVEQRARPQYRVFLLDPATGAVETVYTVPADAIIFDIALSPDASTLAVAYSPDFELDGSGVRILDLESGELEEWAALEPGVYLTDLAWTEDGSAVLATHVDRRGDDELLTAVELGRGNHALTLAEQAINPVELDGVVYYLTVDDDMARRAIGVLDGAARSTLAVGGGALDLDHLTSDHDAGLLRVASVDLDEAGLGLGVGTTADAHGSHDVPATWWQIDADGGTTVLPLEPIIVYDAAATTDSIVYATSEGLAVGTDTRIDLVKSRAIRFVAA